MAEQHITFIKNIRDRLNEVSPSFCLAKWLQVTVHLGTGKTHSCHHPRAHTVGLDEIAADPGALHNSRTKQKERDAMMQGQQPPACDYCWRIENSQPEAISDRHIKSASPWAFPFFDQALAAAKAGQPIAPKYLEVNMGTTCNLRCLYCSPEFSSKWAEDTARHGGYKLPSKTMYEPMWMTQHGMDQIPDPNPYEAAFDKWFPTIASELHTLRLTGGEPLLNKGTFTVMEELIANPRPDLEFAINTNLCVPNKLIDKLIDCLQRMDGKVKTITVFTSAEATGVQQEFIRDGMDWDQFVTNVDRVLRETKVRLTFMTTISALSYNTFEWFVEYVLRLRQEFDATKLAGNYSRVGLSTNYMRHPDFLSLHVLNIGTRATFKRMCERVSQMPGLFVHEREQLIQLGKWAMEASPSTSLDYSRDLRVFLEEVQRRRGLDHTQVFPDLLKRVGI